MKRYKLRVYVTFGPDKGDLDHEEFFDSIEKLDKRYNELFDYNLFSLNPTAWVRNENNYRIISGY